MEESNKQLKKNNKDLETIVTKLEKEALKLDDWSNLIGCDDYNVLNDSTRKTSFYSEESKDRTCDNIQIAQRLSPDWKGEGWYRVIEPAGTKLADTLLNDNHCGTVGARYVQGSHPTNFGETVFTKACYRKHCEQPQDIKIRNCGKYFLYYLPETSSCWQGYCTV